MSLVPDSILRSNVGGRPRELRGPPGFDGLDPAHRMLRSDLPLRDRFPGLGADPAPWRPFGSEGIHPLFPKRSEEEWRALRQYVQDREANHVIPPEGEGVEEDEKLEGSSVETMRWGASSTGGGVESTTRRSRKRNPDGTVSDTTGTTHGNGSDFFGKFKEVDFTLIEGSASAETSAEVASGTVGSSDSWATGSGNVLGARAGASSSGSIGSDGIRGKAGASASAEMLRGSAETRDEGLLRAGASGHVVSADARIEGEVVMTPDKAVASGELGGRLSLFGLTFDADYCWSPRRVANFYVNRYNWLVNEDHEGLGEEWDIGICVGGEVGVDVGAQAGVEGEVGYEGGRAKAEAGARIGLGVGANAKGRVQAIGLDRIPGWFRGD